MAAPDGDLLALTEQLSATVNAVTDGITVQAPDGRLLLANDAAADMLGFSSASALLGVAPAQIIARFELLDVEGRPLDVGRLPGRAALAGADPPEMVVRFRLRGSGVERFSQVSARAVRDDTGAVAFAVNVFRDVTDRQIAIEELRASEARQGRPHNSSAASVARGTGRSTFRPRSSPYGHPSQERSHQGGQDCARPAPSGSGSVRLTVDDPRIMCGTEPAVPS